jgi:hypothetical protein
MPANCQEKGHLHLSAHAESSVSEGTHWRNVRVTPHGPVLLASAASIPEDLQHCLYLVIFRCLFNLQKEVKGCKLVFTGDRG